MKYRLWINIPPRHVRLISSDADGPYDLEILMTQLLEALPDAVAGIDRIENVKVKHKLPREAG